VGICYAFCNFIIFIQVFFCLFTLFCIERSKLWDDRGMEIIS